MIKLEMMNRDGEVISLFYDQHTSAITDDNGFRFVDFSNAPSKSNRIWEQFTAIDYDQPGRKTRKVGRLKIQLGLGCNMSCSYCLQAEQVSHATNTSSNDAENFLNNIDNWIEEPTNTYRVELWGGEPLLYWRKIERLVPGLKVRFPNARFVLITNGTLLTKEIVDQLKAWDFTVAISHDGPGYSVRGSDPFEDPVQFANIEYAYRTLHPRFAFNAVLTPKSYDVNAVIDWFHDYFPECNVGFEGVVHSYAGEPNSVFTLEQLGEFSQTLSEQLIDGTALRSSALKEKLKGVIDSLVNERPSSSLFQKCGMDMPDSIAVDLLGNVMTCQNTGAKGKHNIGHVSEFEKISLNTSRHWSKREECQSCPVLQLCQGSCMYQSGDGWTNSCNAEFYYNMAFLRAALFVVTGRILVGFSGNIVRPLLKAQKNVEVQKLKITA